MLGRDMRAGVYSISFVLVTACASDPASPPSGADASVADAAPEDGGVVPISAACPRAPAVPGRGDVNGDGALDVADAVALANARFRGGRAPACFAGADFNGDGRVELDDATRIATYLARGTQVRGPDPSICGPAIPWPAPECVPLGFRFLAPSGSGRRATVQLAVESPEVDVQGWSVSVASEGCTVRRASTDGTRGAEVWDEPPGLRHLGYTGTAAVRGGAVGLVILSFTEDVVLPAGLAAQPVLALEVEADGPGCRRCRLESGDGLTWEGQPMDAVLVVNGFAFRPEPAILDFELCGD